MTTHDGSVTSSSSGSSSSSSSQSATSAVEVVGSSSASHERRGPISDSILASLPKLLSSPNLVRAAAGFAAYLPALENSLGVNAVCLGSRTGAGPNFPMQRMAEQRDEKDAFDIFSASAFPDASPTSSAKSKGNRQEEEATAALLRTGKKEKQRQGNSKASPSSFRSPRSGRSIRRNALLERPSRRDLFVQAPMVAAGSGHSLFVTGYKAHSLERPRRIWQQTTSALGATSRRGKWLLKPTCRPRREIDEGGKCGERCWTRRWHARLFRFLREKWSMFPAGEAKISS